MTIPTPKTVRAARAAARHAATHPDPATAVRVATRILGDGYRVGVSRPGRHGATLRVVVARRFGPFNLGASATAEVER